MDKHPPRHYYLWIKVFDSTSPDHGKPDPALEDIGARYGNRPPRIAANVEKSCWWVFDPTYYGVQGSKLRIGYSPKSGTYTEAVAWLYSPDGADWLLGARTFELISFSSN